MAFKELYARSLNYDTLDAALQIKIIIRRIMRKMKIPQMNLL